MENVIVIEMGCFCFGAFQIGGSGGTYVLYDTFSFKLTLPPTSVVLEFCVCFRSEGTEYWDSYEVRLMIVISFTQGFV